MTDSLLINFDRHRHQPAHLTRAASATTTHPTLARPSFLHSYSTAAVPPVHSHRYSSGSVSGESRSSDEVVGGGERGGKRRYQCLEPDCDKTFSTSGHRSRHHKIHKGEAEKRWACPFSGCSSKFTRKDHQTQHYKTHFPRAAKAPRSLKLIGRARTYPAASAESPIPSPNPDQVLELPAIPTRVLLPAPSPLVSPAVAPAPEPLAASNTGLLVPATPLTGCVTGLSSGFAFGSPSFARFPVAPGVELSGGSSGTARGEDGMMGWTKQPASAQQAQFASHAHSGVVQSPSFAPPQNSPPPWLRLRHEHYSPIKAPYYSPPKTDSPIEIRLAESCSLARHVATNQPPAPTLEPLATPHSLRSDPTRPRAPNLVITPAGFDATRRAFSLAEGGSAGPSPEFCCGEGGVLDAAARRWSWQSGLPSAMAMLPSPGSAGGTYFGQVQAEAGAAGREAFTLHFGVDETGCRTGLGGEAGDGWFESAGASPGASLASAVFSEGRSASFSSAGDESAGTTGWVDRSQAGCHWSPSRSFEASQVLGVRQLVESPVSMSPDGDAVWTAVEPFHVGAARLGVPSLHLSSQSMLPGCFGNGSAMSAAPMSGPQACVEPDSPWAGGAPPSNQTPPSPVAPFAPFADPFQTPVRGPPCTTYVTPVQQGPTFTPQSACHPQLPTVVLEAGAMSLESPGWSRAAPIVVPLEPAPLVVPLEPAPLLDGYNEV